MSDSRFNSLLFDTLFREAIVRRPTFPLKAGHKAAYLYTEITEYRYMLTLDAPKAWFQSNVDTIVNTYGPQHNIRKEDLYLSKRFTFVPGLKHLTFNVQPFSYWDASNTELCTFRQPQSPRRPCKPLCTT